MSNSHPLASDSDSEDSFDFISSQLHDNHETDSPIFPASPSSKSLDSQSSQSSASSSKNKYLYPVSDTVEELRPDEVRWFFKQSTDKKWIPFIGYDSLRIECKYREISRQREKGNTVTGIDPERICVRGRLFEVDVGDQSCCPIYWDAKENSTEIMRGTWFYDSTWQPVEEPFASDIEKHHLQAFLNQSISEKKDETAKSPVKVLTAVYFKDFYVEWNAIDQTNLHYQTASSRLKRVIGNKFGLSQGGTPLRRGYCYEADMYDKPADIGHLVFVVHGIGQKMDMGSIVQRCAELRETCEKMTAKHCKDLDSDKDKRAEFLPVEWRSLLKLDGDIVDSITPVHSQKLRSLLNSSAMDIMYYTSPLYRTEITQALQTELNRLYRMFCDRTPYFEATGGKVSIIAHSLGSVITYDIITGWNPVQLYDKYVSSVISSESAADLSNNAEKCSLLGAEGDDLLSKLQEARDSVSAIESQLFKLAATRHTKKPTMNFKLTNLFMIGSPLSVFLALRGIRPQSTGTIDHIISTDDCERIFNVYHPHDPVAYRIEPLVLKHYYTIMPLKIYPQDAPNKVPYENLPAIAYGEKKLEKAEEKKTPEKNNNSKDKDKHKKEKEKKDSGGNSGWSNWFKRANKESGGKISAELKVMSLKELEESSPATSDTDGDVVISSDLSRPEIFCTNGATEQTAIDWYDGPIVQTELEYRVDYQLHKGKMANAYWGALTSHTAYWTNQDVALFILQQLHPDHFNRENDQEKQKKIEKK